MKKFLCITLGVLLPFLMASCLTAGLIGNAVSSSHKATFDKTLSKEQSTEITFNDGIHVRTYNGIDVDTEWYGKNWKSSDWVRATLPAGQSEFGFDLRHVEGGWGGSKIYNATDLTFKYYLEPEKKYSFFFTYNKEEKTWGLALHDVSRSKKGERLKFWPMNF